MKKLSNDLVQQLVKKFRKKYPEEKLAETAIFSYSHSNFLINWLFWRRLEVMDSFILKKNKKAKALDFGCGLGLLTYNLSSKFKKVYAVDIFDDFVREVIKIKKLKNVEASSDVFGEKIKKQKFDYVFAADVLEHIKNPTKYIKYFNKILDKKGFFVISGPSENFIYKICRVIAGYDKYNDYHYHDIYELDRRIQKNNFKKIREVILPLSIFPLFKILMYKKIK